MLRPGVLLALHRQGLLLSSFHPMNHLTGTSNITTRANNQFPRPDSHRLDTQPCGLRQKEAKVTKKGGRRVFDRMGRMDRMRHDIVSKWRSKACRNGAAGISISGCVSVSISDARLKESYSSIPGGGLGTPSRLATGPARADWAGLDWRCSTRTLLHRRDRMSSESTPGGPFWPCN